MSDYGVRPSIPVGGKDTDGRNRVAPCLRARPDRSGTTPSLWEVIWCVCVSTGGQRRTETGRCSPKTRWEPELSGLIFGGVNRWGKEVTPMDETTQNTLLKSWFNNSFSFPSSTINSSLSFHTPFSRFCSTILELRVPITTHSLYFSSRSVSH